MLQLFQQNLLDEESNGAIDTKTSGVEHRDAPKTASQPSQRNTSSEKFSSHSSHESQSVKETTFSTSSESRVSTTETISKAAISEIVVTVPQEVVWKEEVRSSCDCTLNLFKGVDYNPPFLAK